MTAISGNTYPVKDAIRALGGKWNKDDKAWMVPDDKAEEARALVAQAPKSTMPVKDRIASAARKRGETPGRCYSCGDACKFPYTECWDCREERMMGY